MRPPRLSGRTLGREVTDTPTLSLIPGHEDLVKIARQRNRTSA